MSFDDAKIENISNPEVKECIRVFDAEFKILLNKAPDGQALEIEKYSMNTGSDHEVHIEVSQQDKKIIVPFEIDFFEDYCYCNRKERDLLLKDTLNLINGKMKDSQ